MSDLYQLQYNRPDPLSNGSSVNARWYDAGAPFCSEEAVLHKVNSNPHHYIGANPRFRIVQITKKVLTFEFDVKIKETE